MSKGAFISSAVLHGVILTLMAMDFSFAKFDHTAPPPAILMVDLTKVKISDKTNLPPKVTVQPKKAKPQPTKPKEISAPKPTKIKAQPVTPPKPEPKPQPPVPNSAPMVEEPKVKTVKNEKGKALETTAKSKTPEPSPEDKLKSLLTSVDKVRRNAPSPTEVAEKDKLNLSDGIENGTEGSLSQVLTVSERDLIASQLSSCWNLDAGKKDIDDMIVEIRVHVNKDGSIQKVKIVNEISDPIFISVAESAQRAVHICAQDPSKSPFKILAEKYAEHYGEWKSLFLRFNPKTGGVM